MIDLSKHYDTLTAPERLKVALDAMARGDWEEVRKLGETCPKITYQPQRDLAFTDKYQSLQTMALLHAVSFYQIRGAMIAALYTGDTLAYSLRHAEMMAYIEAWQRFCEYAGLEPETVLKAFGLKLETSWLDDMPPGDGELDEDLTKDIYQGHLRNWA